MFLASRPIIRPRKGVSEVMGAILLIMVVVVAVASLAAFVAVAEKSAQGRQTYLTSVKNDNLQIAFAQFTVDETPVPPSTSSNSNCPTGFETCWASVMLTIRNLNTEPSSLSQIKIAGFWADQWEQVSGGVPGFYGPQVTYTTATTTTSTTITTTTYPNLGAEMLIPARGTVSIYLAFDSSYFPAAITEPLVTQSISITMLSVLGNFFTTVYNPPTAIAHVSLSSVNYQYYDRDVVSLDGSLSTAANQSTIVSYAWNVLVPVTAPTKPTGSPPPGCTAAEFSIPGDYTSVQVVGKTAQLLQESFQSSPDLLQTIPPASYTYCLTGPFEISLTVNNSMGFIATSNPIIIPVDPNMAPIASFSAATSACPNSCTVGGSVETIFGTAPASGTTILLAYPGGQQTVVIPAGSSTWESSSSFACASGNNIIVTLGALPAQILSC